MIEQSETGSRELKRSTSRNKTKKKRRQVSRFQKEKGVADIIQLFKDSEVKANEEKDKKEALEKEVQQAEEFRRQSLETIGETRKRSGESDSNSKGKRKKSNDTIEYLKEKSKQEKELKQQEMVLKKMEIEERKAESMAFREMLLQQQQNSALLMQQQQQVNMALLQFLAQKKD